MADSYDNDLSLRVSFTPAAIRQHFEGSDREEASERLSDELLAKLADEILGSSHLLWQMFDEICGEIVRRAERIEAEGSEAQLLVGSQ